MTWRSCCGVGVTLLAALLVLTAVALPACGPIDSGERPLREIAPPSPEELEATRLLREARRLLEEDELERAEVLLRQVVELQPERAEGHALLGGTLLRLRKEKPGQESLRRAIELDPDLGDSRDRLARSLFRTGDLETAEAVYRAWVAYAEEDADALYGLGQTLYARGDLSGARKAFMRAARNQASRADIRSELGLVLHALGKLKQSEAAQRDALERDPQLAVAWFRLGTVIAELDPSRRAAALEAFDKAIGLDPGHITARLYDYRLLRELAADGDDEFSRGAARKAGRRLKQILNRHAREQLPWFGLSERPDAAKHGKRETKRLQKQVFAEPKSARARRALGEHLHARGEVHDAVESYQRALELDPQDSEINALLGAALLWLGRLESARPFLDAALHLRPNDVHVLRLRAWLHVRENEPAAALRLYERVLAQRPDDARAKKARGLVWMIQGRLDEGLRAIADAGWLRR